MLNFKTAADFAADESFQEYCFGNNLLAAKQWQTYIEEHPELLEEIEEAKMIVNMLQLRPSEIDVPSTKVTKKNQPIKYRSIFSTNKMWAVASVLLIIFSALFYFSLASKSQLITQTAENEIRTFSLMDGSKVTLNKGAEIKYASSWSKSKPREIWIEGDAFFEVEDKPSEGAPKFIVHTREGDVMVLGTSFLVRQNKDEFGVILHTGKLVFSSHSDEDFLIEPGHGIFEVQGELFKEKAKMNYYDLWRSKELSFNNTELQDLIGALDESFGIEIEIKNKRLLDRVISASVPNNDPHILLAAISELYDIKMSKEGNKIILN